MTVLKRRPDSGFVNFPKEFDKRILDGSARFRTKCDMLIGPCSCGSVHRERDEFTRSVLSHYRMTIEPLVLTVVDGTLPIPRYWDTGRHDDCDVLVGDCSCGQKHTGHETWVLELLAAHCAEIVGRIDPPVKNVPAREERVAREERAYRDRMWQLPTADIFYVTESEVRGSTRRVPVVEPVEPVAPEEAAPELSPYTTWEAEPAPSEPIGFGSELDRYLARSTTNPFAQCDCESCRRNRNRPRNSDL